MKKILLFFAACFLAYQSYILFVNLNQMRFDSLLGNIFLSWVINMFVTGVFAFLSFGFPVERSLPEVYYKIHNPALLRKIYNILKIDSFRQLLLKSLWRGQQQRKKYFDGTRAGLEGFIIQSKQAEWGHAFPFLILLVYSFNLVLVNNYFLASLVLFFNIIGNFYPVMLQRNHRYRIGLLMTRLSAQVANK